MRKFFSIPGYVPCFSLLHSVSILLLKAIRYDPDAAATVSIDAMKFTGIAIGILLVILGNIMPKMRRNAMFGLRTK